LLDGPVLLKIRSNSGGAMAELISRGRRKFLNWFLNTSLGASIGMMLYPLVRFVIPPLVAEAESVTSVVGKVSELPINSGKVARLGSRAALVIRKADGSFLAFDATCTHLSCIVQYKSDVQQIWCACHNGTFDLTGKNISGPPPRPLAPLQVNVVGEDIVLSRT
jgi:Rieske Fe-S protein